MPWSSSSLVWQSDSKPDKIVWARTASSRAVLTSLSSCGLRSCRACSLAQRAWYSALVLPEMRWWASSFSVSASLSWLANPIRRRKVSGDDKLCTAWRMRLMDPSRSCSSTTLRFKSRDSALSPSTWPLAPAPICRSASGTSRSRSKSPGPTNMPSKVSVRSPLSASWAVLARLRLPSFPRR